MVGWRGERREAQGLHDRVVQGGPDLLDLRIFSSGMDAIGQEGHEELAVGVDPDASAGEAGVAETVGGEIVAAASAFGGDGPAERACAI